MRLPLTLFMLLTSLPASASLVYYSYAFDYYDISGCPPSCSPSAKQGAGQVVVDSTEKSLQSIALTSDDFSFNWSGSALFLERDRWSLPNGDLYSISTAFDEQQYHVEIFLDLFFVPTGENPIDYFENVTEDFNTVSTGDKVWNFHGKFSKLLVAEVPEPSPIILFATGFWLIIRHWRC